MYLIFCVCNTDIPNLQVILIHLEGRLHVTLLLSEILLYFRNHLSENVPLKLIR